MAASGRTTARATIVDVALTAPVAIENGPQSESEQSGPAPSVPAPTVGGRDQLPAGRLSRRRPAVVAAVLVVGVVIGLQFLPTTTGDPSDPPTSIVSSPAVTPSTSAPSQTPGSTGPTSRISPTATAPATSATLRAGDGCTWQQEGDRQIGVGGTALVCSVVDGGYQWRPPG